MRLNKYISGTGVCSRREADAWIDAGRVTINGAPATLGTRVGPDDVVEVDGQRVGEAKSHVYIALNKPVGITCTTEPDVRGNIIDYINFPERIFPIGRLDKDSQGLILLTNHGDIVNRILRAENGHEKEYIVTVDRPVTSIFLDGLASGVRIMGIVTQPCRVRRLALNSFNIVLTQGLNRQIRRMCSFYGYHVVDLQRVRIMDITLDDLEVGEWRRLNPFELWDLLKAAE